MDAKPKSRADRASAKAAKNPSPNRAASNTGKPRPNNANRDRNSSADRSDSDRRPGRRQGIIEVAPDFAADAGSERIGEAPIRDMPDTGKGWDINDPGSHDFDEGDTAAEDFVGDDFATDQSAEDESDDADDTNEPDAIEARQRVRLQRVLADAGVAARRHAEGLIEQGRVTVNGLVVTELPCFVDPHFDRIHVDGRLIPKPARHVYVMFHKPERVLVTDSDEPGMDRKTLRDYVQHPGAPRLFAIGRLDFQTTGVVLMTNDGELANRVSHPRANLAKTYHLVVKGAPTPQNMRVFTRAAAQGDRETAKADPRLALKLRSRPRTPLEVRVITSDPAKSMLEVTTRDERNLDLRGACLAAGLPVKKITRVSYGPVRLTALPLGNWRELTRPEINTLKKAARLAKDGRASPPPSNPGVDFSNIPPEKFGEANADQVGVNVARPSGRDAASPAARIKPSSAKPAKPGQNRSAPSKPGQSKPVHGKQAKPAPRPALTTTKSPAKPARPPTKPSRDPEPRPTTFRPRVIS